MTLRIYPRIDGTWSFNGRTYETFVAARLALSQYTRRVLREERRQARLGDLRVSHQSLRLEAKLQ